MQQQPQIAVKDILAKLGMLVMEKDLLQGNLNRAVQVANNQQEQIKTLVDIAYKATSSKGKIDTLVKHLNKNYADFAEPAGASASGKSVQHPKGK